MDSLQGAYLDLKFDSHIINASRPNTLRLTYLALGPWPCPCLARQQLFHSCRIPKQDPNMFPLEILILACIDLTSILDLMFLNSEKSFCHFVI